MPTRNVVLTDHQSEFLDSLVASGQFQNASEAMRASLRMMEEGQKELRAYLDKLRADLEAEDFVEGDWKDILDEALAKAKARGTKRKAS